MLADDLDDLRSEAAARRRPQSGSSAELVSSGRAPARAPAAAAAPLRTTARAAAAAGGATATATVAADARVAATATAGAKATTAAGVAAWPRCRLRCSQAYPRVAAAALLADDLDDLRSEAAARRRPQRHGAAAARVEGDGAWRARFGRGRGCCEPRMRPPHRTPKLLAQTRRRARDRPTATRPTAERRPTKRAASRCDHRGDGARERLDAKARRTAATAPRDAILRCRHKSGEPSEQKGHSRTLSNPWPALIPPTGRLSTKSCGREEMDGSSPFSARHRRRTKGSAAEGDWALCFARAHLPRRPYSGSCNGSSELNTPGGSEPHSKVTRGCSIRVEQYISHIHTFHHIAVELYSR